MNTVAVIGGGASGMVAALTAAEDKDNRVVLFERQQRPARKLLATGNGRCNLTNTFAAPKNYHGEQAGFADAVLGKFTPADTLDFFRALGLLTVEEYGGRVYPLSNSANSVADVLRFALEKAGVEIRTAEPVRELKRGGNGYLVITDTDTLNAEYVIVACGGAAGAKLGGVSDGYKLLGDLGHKRTKLYPALVQLVTDVEYPKALKGVRADCAIKLVGGGTVLDESRGELQFTDNGVSGPAAFDISRTAALSGEGTELVVDFMREYGAEQTAGILAQRCRTFPELETAQLFTGMLHNRLGRMLVKYAALPAGAPLAALSETQIKAAAKACKEFRLRLLGTEGFDNAQVTAGGVKTSGFDPLTLQSWFNPRLFACGEVLDVDGDCGGYNLQWAWASGRTAGRLGK